MATVNSSTNSAMSALSAKTGLGGLVSGMDIDELVESLTATSRQKILKQQQNLQLLQWKQTSYRSVTTALKEFQSKYLDVLSGTNFRSESFFKTVVAASSSDKVKVSATASASAGTITINSVSQLATNQTYKSSAVTRALTGKLASTAEGTMTSDDIDKLLTDLSGKSIRLTLDGRIKTITFDSDFAAAVNAARDGDGNLTEEGFQNALQASVDAAFGVKDVTGGTDRVLKVSVSDGKLNFSATGSQVTINAVNTDTSALDLLGFTSGQSSKLNTTTSIKDLPFANGLTSHNGLIKFTINSEVFTFKDTDSLSTIMNKINSSKAGVKLSYSSITDQFTMTANASGSGNNIQISESSGNLMTALGLTADTGVDIKDGVNAVLTVNGQLITRSSNTIDIDGVQITISEKPTEPVTITMTNDATSLMDSIKGFVEDYNKMIDMINGLMKEEVNKDYQPLSDAEKAEMSEAQIKAWEDKAKSGILRGDSILRSISSKLHSTMTTMSIDGVSLASIGITSAGYGENGKLKITSESKLLAALQEKGTEIRKLFTSEKGLSNTLNDIITKATKTSGVKGTRGTLVEAAGVASTMSDTENSIYDQIKRTNKAISALQIRLTAEESRLWSRFTAMEQALSLLNTQSAMLTQFSSGS